MNLNLFVSSHHIWLHLLSFWSLKGTLQLRIWKFHQDMKHKSESSQSCTCTWWIHISNSASISHMLLQQEVRLSIAWTTFDSLRIIGKVHSSVLDSLETRRTMMLSVKHSIFPVNSTWVTERTRGLISLKLISIVSVLQKEVEMCVHMHVNDDWCKVNDVMMQICKILSRVS